MAKVFRCPACGALWRVSDQFDEPRLCCSECKAVFSADKAESLTVSDEALDAHQPAVHAEPVLAAEPAPAEKGESAPALRAERTETSPTPARSHSGFWTLLFLLASFTLAGAALLLCHDKVIEQLPQARSVYEQVCGKVPCPGFVWCNADAIRTDARLLATAPAEDEAAHEAQALMPRVTCTLENTSTHPQALPQLELRLLNIAGDTVGSRLLEPGDYGYPADAVLLPGRRVTVELTVTKPLSVPAADVRVKPVENH